MERRPSSKNGPAQGAPDARNNANYVRNVADITDFYLTQLQYELSSRYPRNGVIQLKAELLRVQEQALVDTQLKCDSRLETYLEFLNALDKLEDQQLSKLAAELTPVTSLTTEKLTEVLKTLPKKRDAQKNRPRPKH
ncbi:MAG: hypothetical protein V4490_01340 [Pseudomonadota bacterium]